MKSELDPQISLVPFNATNTRTGTGVDILGYDGALAVVSFGVLATGTQTPKLQYSADKTTFTDVGTADQVGTFAAATATTVQRVSYVGNQRYLRPFITAGASTDVANSVGLIVRGKGAGRPLS